MLKFILSPLVRLIWIKNVTGIENIPDKGPVILAFNHQSYFDFIGFMAITPRPIYYLAAEKFYTKETNWLWTPIMKATRQIRVNRTNMDKHEVYEAVDNLMENNNMLGIFPEGTRVSSGQTMQRGYTGVIKFAISNNVPVIPIGIKGAYEIMSRNDNKPKFKKILEFHVGTSVLFSKYTKKSLTDDKLLQELTDSIMHKIAKLSGKSYPYGQ